jgi:hypothetical protein
VSAICSMIRRHSACIRDTYSCLSIVKSRSMASPGKNPGLQSGNCPQYKILCFPRKSGHAPRKAGGLRNW